MDKLQTVYIPTKEVLSTNIIDYIDQRFSRVAPKDYIVRELKKYFKSTEAFVFTPEELKQLIIKAVDDTINAYHYYVESPHNPPPMNGNDYFENFLNKEK